MVIRFVRYIALWLVHFIQQANKYNFFLNIFFIPEIFLLISLSRCHLLCIWRFSECSQPESILGAGGTGGQWRWKRIGGGTFIYLGNCCRQDTRAVLLQKPKTRNRDTWDYRGRQLPAQQKSLLATRAVQKWFAYAVAHCPSRKYSAKATSWQGAFAEHKFESI